MKVNHLENYDTHAVIGGNNVVEFKMAQTAEFFTILSSTLYSNKPLAVAREVLCNAWDSHIASGRTDKPINITLSESNLIIRDYGLGINPDNMQDIYCTYGNSTKANDGTQTGGFGLGSKSPFAYSDHFSVTDYYDGLKIVYAISRGSQLTQGKPDMRVMVKVPSTETGVEVNIPIKSKSDMNTFRAYLIQIASLGEMNVVINSVPVNIVPISKGQDNFFITKLPTAHDGPLQIRYGNVVYPIASEASYNEQYQALVKELKRIPGGNRWDEQWKLILQAEPNTISVTPSRESLSMTETTINTIKGLLTERIKHINFDNRKFVDLLFKNIPSDIDYMWNTLQPHKMLTQSLKRNKGNDEVPDYLTCIEDVAKLYAARADNLPYMYHQREREARFQSLIDNNYRRKQDIYTLNKIIKQSEKTKKKGTKLYNFKNHILRPIAKSLIKHPILNVKNMFITTSKRYYERSTFNVSFDNILEVKIADQAIFNSLVQGVVVIANTKKAYDDHYHSKQFGQKEGQYVYIAPRNPEHREAAIKHFQKLGFLVVDFYSWYEEHKAPVVTTTISTPSKPKVTGLITLESLTNNSSYKPFNPRGHRDDKHPHKRIINPEYIIQPHQLSGVEYSQKFFAFGDDYGKTVVNLFGSKGGIVVNSVQYEHYLKKGARDGYEYIIENVANEILTNPRIRSYLEFTQYDKPIPVGLTDLIEIGKNSYIIKSKYNLPTALNEEDKEYLDLWNYMIRKSDKSSFGFYEWEKLINKKIIEIKAIGNSNNFYDLIKLFENNPMINSVNWVNINTLFKSNPSLNHRIKLEMLIINTLGN